MGRQGLSRRARIYHLYGSLRRAVSGAVREGSLSSKAWRLRATLKHQKSEEVDVQLVNPQILNFRIRNPKAEDNDLLQMQLPGQRSRYQVWQHHDDATTSGLTILVFKQTLFESLNNACNRKPIELPGFVVRFVMRGAVCQNYATSCLCCSLWLGSASFVCLVKLQPLSKRSSGSAADVVTQRFDLLCDASSECQARQGKVCVAALAGRGSAQASFLFSSSNSND